MLFKPRERTDGELIRDARKLRRWSALDLANAIGVREQTVYRWEWDQCRASDKKMTAICLALSVPIGSLRAKVAKKKRDRVVTISKET